MIDRLTFSRVMKKKNIEGFSCVPYVLALFNCCLYTWYGLPIVSYQWENFPVVTINGIGILLEVSFILIYLWFSSTKVKVSYIYIWFNFFFLKIVYSMIIFFLLKAEGGCKNGGSYYSNMCSNRDDIDVCISWTQASKSFCREYWTCCFNCYVCFSFSCCGKTFFFESNFDIYIYILMITYIIYSN